MLYLRSIFTMKKIILYLLAIISIGCEIENIDPLAPIMITEEPTNIQANSATLGGFVLGEGGRPVTEYGGVIGISNPPTVQDVKIQEGTGIGFFSNTYNNLESNTTYYYSAYGINEIGVGYGQIYQFTTDPAPSCDPQQENSISTGFGTISINNISLEDPSGFNDGNLEFETSTFNSTLRIKIRFNEVNGNLPLTGAYTTVSSFETPSDRSNGEVSVYIEDFGIGNQGGGTAPVDETLFVENDGNTITFIFCNFPVGSAYELNGKCTYTN